MTLKQTHFELGLLVSRAFFFQVFNATNNLKVTRVTHCKNLTELKSDKACFRMFLIKYFATNFIFNGSRGSILHDKLSLLQVNPVKD